MDTGHSYLVTVQAKGFTFDPDSRLIALTDDITGVNFFAAPQ